MLSAALAWPALGQASIQLTLPQWVTSGRAFEGLGWPFAVLLAGPPEWVFVPLLCG